MTYVPKLVYVPPKGFNLRGQKCLWLFYIDVSTFCFPCKSTIVMSFLIPSLCFQIPSSLKKVFHPIIFCATFAELATIVSEFLSE
ncbi:hypothetical protein VIGAN_11213300 [Vigna angularis var. angularis]|uniref:Uncharacterized protein n=1 Tax=Vigna angularis var. angularis TaxID=157739 RepID=A0A0S3TBY1_PHAAN|nr:hypothetical protein VIGAN_11213300 [Vigna angularis var. angularis]